MISDAERQALAREGHYGSRAEDYEPPPQPCNRCGDVTEWRFLSGPSDDLVCIACDSQASAEAKRIEITDAMVERAVAGWLEEINRSHAAGETEAEWSRRDTVRAILLAALSPERGG